MPNLCSTQQTFPKSCIEPSLTLNFFLYELHPSPNFGMWNIMASPYWKHSPNFDARIWQLSILEPLTKLCRQSLMKIPHRILPPNFDAKVWWGFQVTSSHQIHQSLMGMPRFGWDSLLILFHFLRFHNHYLIISIVSM